MVGVQERNRKAGFGMRRLRALIVIVCLAALLASAMAPGACGLPALVAPFWLFFEILAIAWILGISEEPELPVSPFVAASGSRAPPVR